jgi:2-dehydropantoate 2-reductase
MKLAIVTAGAVGGYFGGLLVGKGSDITFVARGEHLRVLQESGLTLKKPDGDLVLPPDQYRATENVAQAVKGADMVLFAVKSFDTRELALALLPGLGETVPVLSLQNGVENEELLSAILEPQRTAGGVAYVFAQLTAPGEITATSSGKLVLAERTMAEGPVAHLAEFTALCEAANVPFETTTDISKIKWTKLVYNSALNGWTTFRQTTLDHLLADPETRRDFEATLRETAEVALALGIKLDRDVVARTMELALSMGAVGSSMLGDLEMGRRLEYEALTGYIVRKGYERGIPTPYNAMLFRELSALNLSRN